MTSRTALTTRPASRIAVAILASSACLALAGCGQDGEQAQASVSSVAGQVTSAASNAVDAGKSATASFKSDAGLEASDTWVRAVPELGDQKMTGVFGKIKNGTDAEIQIVAVKSDTSAHTELHETVTENGQKVMRQVTGGFTIPAGATRVLEPGGDHVMLMNLAKPIPAGTTVTVTLTTKDGKTLEFTAAARPFTGEQERYAGDGHTSR